MALAIHEPCPAFELPATDDNAYSLASFASDPILVVIVSCNHCPYVVAYEERMVALAKEYGGGNAGPKKVAWMAVNANDATRYPDDAMQPMKVRARDRGFPFPYLRDDSQAFVRALGARFTPEVFVFDAERKLRYHGRIDDNHRDSRARAGSGSEPARANERSVTAHDLKNALDALLAGRDPPVLETTAVGCSVKWK